MNKTALGRPALLDERTALYTRSNGQGEHVHGSIVTLASSDCSTLLAERKHEAG